MKLHVLLLGLVAGSSVVASADAPSPARVQMDGFVAAFNTGDRAKIEAFGRDHMPPDFLRAAILDQTVQMAEDSGGFEVLDATESDPHALKAHVRERKTKHVIEMSVQVDPAMPERITLITLNGPDERVKDTR